MRAVFVALLALLACALVVAQQPSSSDIDFEAREIATLSDALSLSPADDYAIAQARSSPSGRGTIMLPDTYGIGQKRVNEIVEIAREYRAIRRRVQAGTATAADAQTLALIKQQLHTTWANASPAAREWASAYMLIALNRIDALMVQIGANPTPESDMMEQQPSYGLGAQQPIMMTQPRYGLRYGGGAGVARVSPIRAGVQQQPIAMLQQPIYPSAQMQPIRAQSAEFASDLDSDADFASQLSAPVSEQLALAAADSSLASPLSDRFEVNAPAGPWGFRRGFGWGGFGGFPRFGFGFGFPFGGFGFPFGGIGFGGLGLGLGLGLGVPGVGLGGLWW